MNIVCGLDLSTKCSGYSIYKDGKLITDKNTMKFVLIHELAHIMTVENGHPPIFWKNMGFLLKEANSIGIYDAIDYSKNPVYYCGVLVDKTPYPF